MKKKKQTKKEETRQEVFSEYFPTPIWSAMKPEFVAPLNEATNKYIDEAKIDAIPKIKEKNKSY